ncbi:MAG: hypothetical protein MUP47_06930 [Phycisphaerae bacterium]|nr:hypothetical protein [Phycisphaerae bacterium]
MAIQFVCPNPKCGKLIQVAGDRAGQPVSCPTCRQMVLVPGAAGSVTAKDQAVLDSYQQFLRGVKEHQAPPEQGADPFPSAPPAPPAAPPRVPQRPPGPGLEVDGLDDLSALPRAEVALPAGMGGKAGWVRVWWHSPAPLMGSLWRHCLTAVWHSGADAGSVLAAGLCLAILTTYYRCLLGSGAMLPSDWAVPRELLVAGWGVLGVVLGGYVLVVCLSLTHAAVASGGRMETWLRPTAGRVVRTGLLGLAVLVVYLLPVITLPLLPLAMLTLSLTHDGRAFCFRWQVRSTFAYGEGFAILWLVWLLGAAVVAVVWTGLNWLAGAFAEGVVVGMSKPEAAATRAVVWFVGALVAGVAALLPVCGLARCTGLLARFRPGVLESLPASCKSVVTWGIILVCIIVGAVVTSLWMGAWSAPATP